MSIRNPTGETTRDNRIQLKSFPRRIYRFRSLGMGLGILPIAAVLTELSASWHVWTWAVFCCLVWPHIAYQVASRSADPFRTELRNLSIDSALAGSLAPLMAFNLLPSAIPLTVTSAEKINTGVRGLWLRSLPGLLFGALSVGAFTGFSMQPVTSMTVMLTSLPVMAIGLAITPDLPPGSHAGRIGGDEFAVVLPIRADAAMSVADDILGRVAKLDVPPVGALRCSVSIGTAEPVASDPSMRAWLEAADRALYGAKAAGRNRFAHHVTAKPLGAAYR